VTSPTRKAARQYSIEGCDDRSRNTARDNEFLRALDGLISSIDHLTDVVNKWPGGNHRIVTGKFAKFLGILNGAIAEFW
jgi:hypothetical protein